VKKLFSCLTVLLMTLFLFAGAEAAVDWSDKAITVKGMGTANPQMVRSPAHASMMARRAAIADAYRQLAEMVQGVQVDAETTVEQMMLTSDIVKTKVSAVIKGAVVVDEKALDGGYEVTLKMPLFGDNGLSKAVIEPPPAVEPFPTPAPEVIPSMPADSNTGGAASTAVLHGGENSPMAAIGGYTGLIIDCRGVGTLNPVMSPVIKNVKGVKLYGHENLNYDLVVRDGMVNYATDRNMAGRAGSNPLIIKAKSLADHNANPVVSEEDGSRILIENGATGFLNKTAVVFLY